jgi:hypothetical protein
MKIRKINGELYVEWTTTTAAIKEVLWISGVAVMGIVSFYALWVLLDLLG